MAWRNLPNAITLGRIVLAAVVAPMLMTDDFVMRLGAFIVFLVAAFSDLVDGKLARSRNLITDFGKLMDPLADKLLLGATFIPFFVLSNWTEPESGFPWFSGAHPLWARAVLPWWIVAIIFGREVFITVFRGFAAKRGVVLAAGKAGKLKAVFQNIFIGAAIFWYALQSAARENAWDSGLWNTWQWFHFVFTVVNLAVAVVLTVYSLYVYLRDFSTLKQPRAAG
ncbi:MAG TPA: CDP-alcohol phosphatidyltransferase family protein [Longimicrobium sp.]|nr:CDP-alcohol phosphatidyltransferase family protein [Longimicrobium sp.]